MRIAIDTIGCKLNQAESEHLTRQLAAAGHRLVSPTDKADIYILNTCSVTQSADSDSRRRLRLAHRRSPNARLIATGCYAQLKPDELARVDGVSLVVGNAEKTHILEQLQDPSSLLSPTAECHSPLKQSDRTTRTRAFVKVQQGCSSYCAYCIVPLARGIEQSQPAANVVAEVRQITDEGYKEIVVTGTEIGAYSDDGITLRDLLRRILAETGAGRIRLSSLQPQEVSSELLALWQDDRLCPHFHLSLQSGSESVLRRMKRGYSIADYDRTVRLIRAMVPDAAITTDVIVGFPGETEPEFAESYDFCLRQGFARIHVFPYSPRPGTAASRMSGQVDSRIKKERSRKMLALAHESAESSRKQFLEKTMPVLWETKSHGLWTGLTGNYIKVFAESEGDLANKILPARLVELSKDGMRGEVVDEDRHFSLK